MLPNFDYFLAISETRYVEKISVATLLLRGGSSVLTKTVKGIYNFEVACNIKNPGHKTQNVIHHKIYLAGWQSFKKYCEFDFVGIIW